MKDARWSEFQVEDAAEQLLLYAELARDFASGKAIRVELVILTETKETTIDRHTLLCSAIGLALAFKIQLDLSIHESQAGTEGLAGFRFETFQ